MALAQSLQRNSHMQSVALGYAAMGDATGAALAQAAVKMQQRRQQPRNFACELCIVDVSPRHCVADPSGDEGNLVSRGGSCRLGAFYRRAVARIAPCMSIHTREARKAVSFEA